MTTEGALPPVVSDLLSYLGEFSVAAARAAHRAWSSDAGAPESATVAIAMLLLNGLITSSQAATIRESFAASQHTRLVRMLAAAHTRDFVSDEEVTTALAGFAADVLNVSPTTFLVERGLLTAAQAAALQTPGAETAPPQVAALQTPGAETAPPQAAALAQPNSIKVAPISTWQPAGSETARPRRAARIASISSEQLDAEIAASMKPKASGVPLVVVALTFFVVGISIGYGVSRPRPTRIPPPPGNLVEGRGPVAWPEFGLASLTQPTWLVGEWSCRDDGAGTTRVYQLTAAGWLGGTFTSFSMHWGVPWTHPNLLYMGNPNAQELSGFKQMRLLPNGGGLELQSIGPNGPVPGFVMTCAHVNGKLSFDDE